MPDRDAQPETLLRMFLPLPAVPYREGAVIAAVRDLACTEHWVCREDRAGNLWVSATGTEPNRILVAHMDHPGFVAVRQRGTRVIADFRGYVTDEYFPGARVRFFTGHGEITATVRSLQGSGRESPFRQCVLEVPAGERVPPRSLGLWDLPPVRRRGPWWIGRACDDLVGVAAALMALRRAGKNARRTTILLTRAEEAGFTGAIFAARSGQLPRDAVIISVEASKAGPWARPGAGAIVRVGDRRAIFDPAVTAWLWRLAEQVGREAKALYQRQLMPGGTCEATVFQSYGYRVGAVCVPLVGYHNMGPKGQVVAERIHDSDFRALVELLTAIMRAPPPSADVPALRRRELERIYRERRTYLREIGAAPHIRRVDRAAKGGRRG